MRNSVKKGLIALIGASLIAGAVYLYNRDVGYSQETLRIHYIDISNEPESRSYESK